MGCCRHNVLDFLVDAPADNHKFVTHDQRTDGTRGTARGHVLDWLVLHAEAAVLIANAGGHRAKVKPAQTSRSVPFDLAQRRRGFPSVMTAFFPQRLLTYAAGQVALLHSAPASCAVGAQCRESQRQPASSTG